MTHKSQVRVKIEKILDKELTRTYQRCYIDATSKSKKKYRMKLCTDIHASEESVKRILRIPHVLKVDYSNNSNPFNCNHIGWFRGITIYFDCNPSKIKL
jgi:hypothetical protein